MTTQILEERQDSQARKRISILHLTSSYLPQIGGREFHIRDLATGLAKIGLFDVTILTGSNSSYSDTIENSVRVIRTPYHTIPLGGVLGYRIPHHIFQTVERLKPDIIHSHDHFHSVSLISALLKRNSKLILSCHSQIDFYDSKPLIRSVLKPYDFLIVPFLFHRSNLVTTFGNLRKSLSKFAPIVTSYGFIDTDYIDLTQSVSVQELYGLEKFRTIFFCSRLERRKGAQDLIQAFKMIHTKHPDTFLIISGPDAGELQSLRQQASNLQIKNILFTGAISDSVLHSTLKKSSVFVLPTHSDSAPAAILRAMYLGCPVISTTVGSIPKIIRDGFDGYLVKPQDIHSLAYDIELVLRDDNTFIISNAKKKMESFTLKKYVEDTIRIYEKVLNE